MMTSSNRITSNSSKSFSTMVTPLTLLELERHDDDLANISESCSSDINTAATATATDTDNITDTPNTSNKNASTTSSAPTTTISSVHRNELHRISLIGSGKFCNVHLVAGSSSLRNNSHDNKNCDNNDYGNDNDNGGRRVSARSLFAFKSIDPCRVQNANDLSIATTELANEAKILSELDHENIIKLRGICSEPFSQSFTAGGGGGYFLVLDVLTETLSDRLRRWRKKKTTNKGFRGNYDDNNNNNNNMSTTTTTRRSASLRLRKAFTKVLNICNIKQYKQAVSSTPSVDDVEYQQRQRRMYDRIEETVLGIAKGMEYLHSRNIVLRDLKPANVGYDSNHEAQMQNNNTVRLFDFGMASKVNDCNPNEMCGSARYMAPEVMVGGKGYTVKVDVYSFGILLFEVCSLCVPFAKTLNNKKRNKIRQHPCKMTTNNLLLDDFFTSVVEKQIRPMDDDPKQKQPLESIIPCSKIRALIEECWDTDPNSRPTFKEILSRLRVVFNRTSFTNNKCTDHRDEDEEMIIFDNISETNTTDCESVFPDSMSFGRHLIP